MIVSLLSVVSAVARKSFIAIIERTEAQESVLKRIIALLVPLEMTDHLLLLHEHLTGGSGRGDGMRNGMRIDMRNGMRNGRGNGMGNGRGNGMRIGMRYGRGDGRGNGIRNDIANAIDQRTA